MPTTTCPEAPGAAHRRRSPGRLFWCRFGGVLDPGVPFLLSLLSPHGWGRGYTSLQGAGSHAWVGHIFVSGFVLRGHTGRGSQVTCQLSREHLPCSPLAPHPGLGLLRRWALGPSPRSTPSPPALACRPGRAPLLSARRNPASMWGLQSGPGLSLFLGLSPLRGTCLHTPSQSPFRRRARSWEGAPGGGEAALGAGGTGLWGPLLLARSELHCGGLSAPLPLWSGPSAMSAPRAALTAP